MSAVRPVQVSPTSSLLPLEYPQSVAVFDNYESAQKAVDFLSDHEFPVENLCIVGTDLKLVERVLGRRAWPQVLAGGAMSGLGTGVLLGLLWGLFMPGIGWGSAMVAGIVMGIIMGVLSAGMAHAAARGQRDFNSVTATVATRYEVLGEHKVVPRAREMLQEMPGFRAQQAQGASGGSGLPASLQTSAPWAPTPTNWAPPTHGSAPSTQGQENTPTYGPYGQPANGQSSWGAPSSAAPAPGRQADATWQRPADDGGVPWSAPASTPQTGTGGRPVNQGRPADGSREQSSSGATAWTVGQDVGTPQTPTGQTSIPQTSVSQTSATQTPAVQAPEPIYSPWPTHSADEQTL